jgi:hypothetical protein
MRQKYNKFWPTLDATVKTTNTPCSTGDGIVMAEAAGANLTGMERIQLVAYSAAKTAFTAVIRKKSAQGLLWAGVFWFPYAHCTPIG